MWIVGGGKITFQDGGFVGGLSELLLLLLERSILGTCGFRGAHSIMGILCICLYFKFIR